MIVILKSAADFQLKDSFWINVKPSMVGLGFNFLLLWKSNSNAEGKYFKINCWFSLSSKQIKIKKASENQVLSNLIIGVSLSSERQMQAMLMAKSMIRCTHGKFQSGISSTLNNFTMHNKMYIFNALNTETLLQLNSLSLQCCKIKVTQDQSRVQSTEERG